MGLTKIAGIILLLFYFTFFSLLSAKEVETNSSGLFLSPESCFLLKYEKSCDLVVKISWRTEEENEYCLYQNKNNSPIQCWKKSNHATVDLMINFEENVLFELRAAQTQEIVFSQILKFYRKVSNLKRRRRNPWSFY